MAGLSAEVASMEKEGKGMWQEERGGEGRGGGRGRAISVALESKSLETSHE
jgi:hypothetical protein